MEEHEKLNPESEEYQLKHDSLIADNTLNEKLIFETNRMEPKAKK